MEINVEGMEVLTYLYSNSRWIRCRGQRWVDVEMVHDGNVDTGRRRFFLKQRPVPSFHVRVGDRLSSFGGRSFGSTLGLGRARTLTRFCALALWSHAEREGGREWRRLSCQGHSAVCPVRACRGGC